MTATNWVSAEESTGVFRPISMVVFLVLLSAGTACAKESPNPSSSAPQQNDKIAEAVRVDKSPRLDGTLNDPLWQLAKSITEFRQREPHEGEPSTESTE